jgi:hypothetical protein
LKRRFVCDVCAIAFEWPGQLDEHLALSHADQDYEAVPPPPEFRALFEARQESNEGEEGLRELLSGKKAA